MTRQLLDEKLRHLMEEIQGLGDMVAQATLQAIEALKHRDPELARRLYRGDQALNERRYAIESEALIVIATQQPMAGDLRKLSSILEIATELERMGDYAKGIAKISLLMGDRPALKPLIDLPRMAEKVVDMLGRALDAFVAGDVDQALAIPREDDEVDALYNQIHRELLTFMIADPSTIDQANYLLWAAHNLERMADRVTNICERTLFTVTGEIRELDASDDLLDPP